MSDSEEVESDEEFDLQLEFLDLFDPRRGKKTHAIACGNCTLSLEDVKYVECAECRATICLPCFQLGCEMGDHERDHAYRIVNGLQNRKLKGHWHDMDMTALILAAQKHKLGNWNEYLEDATNKNHTRASVCSFFDQFLVRGIIGQFALTEGFWMKDRHKYKKQGTLQKLLDEETHSNPLIYSMYIAAMRWKKGIKWKPNDSHLEEKIKAVCKEYINYKFDIEGRELLGTLHDDYFFGGDLTLPKPVLLNPEFQEEEEAQSQILRESDRQVVELYDRQEERKRKEREILRQRMTNGEVISLDITPCLPALIFQQEPEPGCSKQEEKAGAPEEPSTSRVSKKSNRPSRNGSEEAPPQPLPGSSTSSTQQSPLKIVLKKGERGNYIVALNTLQSEINKEGTPANILKTRLTKRAAEIGGLPPLQIEGIKDPEEGSVSSGTNGYHTPDENGINGINGVDNSDVEDNEHFTDDNSTVETDDSRLELDTQLDETEVEPLEEAVRQVALEPEVAKPKRGRPRKKVTYVEEEDEDPVPSGKGQRTRRATRKHGDDDEEPRSDRVKLRARRTIRPIVQNDEEEDEAPVVEKRRGRKKNKHIDEGEEENQPEEPRTRRSSRLFIKIPDVDEQEEGEDEEAEEEVPEYSRSRTLNNVISHKKQKRKKKVSTQKSKKLRRIEAFQKRETKKSKKREKALLKYADIITLDQIRALRERCSKLQLFCEEERRRPPPKFKPDDLAMLTFNPNRNEYESESINDAERMVGNLQIGPLTGIHEMTDLEHEVKFARIERYNRALHIRNARKTAINEHDKIFEFIDYIKFMVADPNNTDAMYDTRTPMEKVFQRTQQTLNRDEYNLLVQRWEKFTDLKTKIQKLQELQRQGVTSLKGVDLNSKKKAKPKKGADGGAKKAESRYRSFQKNHLRMYAAVDE